MECVHNIGDGRWLFCSDPEAQRKGNLFLREATEYNARFWFIQYMFDLLYCCKNLLWCLKLYKLLLGQRYIDTCTSLAIKGIVYDDSSEDKRVWDGNLFTADKAQLGCT